MDIPADVVGEIQATYVALARAELIRYRVKLARALSALLKMDITISHSTQLSYKLVRKHVGPLIQYGTSPVNMMMGINSIMMTSYSMRWKPAGRPITSTDGDRILAVDCPTALRIHACYNALTVLRDRLRALTRTGILIMPAVFDHDYPTWHDIPHEVVLLIRDKYIVLYATEAQALHDQLMTTARAVLSINSPASMERAMHIVADSIREIAHNNQSVPDMMDAIDHALVVHSVCWWPFGLTAVRTGARIALDHNPNSATVVAMCDCHKALSALMDFEAAHWHHLGSAILFCTVASVPT